MCFFFFVTELLTSFQTRRDMLCFQCQRGAEESSLLQKLGFVCSKSHQNNESCFYYLSFTWSFLFLGSFYRTGLPPSPSRKIPLSCVSQPNCGDFVCLFYLRSVPVAGTRKDLLESWCRSMYALAFIGKDARSFGISLNPWKSAVNAKVCARGSRYSVRINPAFSFSAVLWTSSLWQKIRKFASGIYWDTWDCCGLLVLVFKTHSVLVELGGLLTEENLQRLLGYSWALFLPAQLYTCVHRQACMRMDTEVAATCWAGSSVYPEELAAAGLRGVLPGNLNSCWHDGRRPGPWWKRLDL